MWRESSKCRIYSLSTSTCKTGVLVCEIFQRSETKKCEIRLKKCINSNRKCLNIKCPPRAKLCSSNGNFYEKLGIKKITSGYKTKVVKLIFLRHKIRLTTASFEPCSTDSFFSTFSLRHYAFLELNTHTRF